MNRRNFLGRAAAAYWARLPRALAWVEAGDSLSGPAYHDQMPDMLASFMANELNALAGRCDQDRARASSAGDVEARNNYVREKLLAMLGPFPAPCPLRAVTVKTLERDGYRIENIMFQSRPDFWVTGNLYVPTGIPGPLPAMVSPCGHYPLARMIPQYQSAYLSLVKSGFVVLGYDPIGQGERRQYWNPRTGQTEVAGGPVFEHSMPGQLLLLLGENFTQYLVWDGMCAIDYLLTRPEVDAQRIGCAGHSGGGTLTQFLTVADQRIQCAAIIEGGTANRWPVHLHPGSRLGPSDIEQNLFPAATYGVDNVDLHAAIAPRPLLAAIEHMNPGFEQAAQAIAQRYQQLGVPERFTSLAADDPHAWTMKLRLATTDWFCRWFYHRPGPVTEPDFAYATPEELYCTPHGSLRDAQKGQTIFSIIQAKQAPLPPVRPAPKSAGELVGFQHEMRFSIAKLLRLRETNQALEPRPVVTTPRKGYRIEKLEFMSEVNIYIPAWVFVPERKPLTGSTILFVSEAGAAADGMEFEGGEESGQAPGFLQSLTLAGNLVVAVDVRGIGETRPAYQPGSTAEPFGQLFDTATALAYMAWFADLSLFGLRVRDVLRSVDYALSRPEATADLRVIGKGSGGLWALYAAALDPRIQTLACQESLLSYRALTAVDRYRYGADVFIPKVLLEFDLPSVAAAVAPRGLTLVSPVDAMKQHAPAQAANQAYQTTREIYQAAGNPDRFRMEFNENPAQFILDLCHAPALRR